MTAEYPTNFTAIGVEAANSYPASQSAQTLAELADSFSVRIGHMETMPADMRPYDGSRLVRGKPRALVAELADYVPGQLVPAGVPRSLLDPNPGASYAAHAASADGTATEAGGVVAAAPELALATPLQPKRWPRSAGVRNTIKLPWVSKLQHNVNLRLILSP